MIERLAYCSRYSSLGVPLDALSTVDLMIFQEELAKIIRSENQSSK